MENSTVRRLKNVIKLILERSFEDAYIQYSEDLSFGYCSTNHGFMDKDLIAPLDKWLTVFTSDIESEREEVGTDVRLNYSANVICPILNVLVKINLVQIDYGTNIGIDYNFERVGHIDPLENPKLATQERVLSWVIENSSDEAKWERKKRANNAPHITDSRYNIFGRKIRHLRKRKSRSLNAYR